MTGDNLKLMWYRAAFWEMLEREQNVELTRRTYELQFEGPFRSVTEKEKNNES